MVLGDLSHIWSDHEKTPMNGIRNLKKEATLYIYPPKFFFVDFYSYIVNFQISKIFLHQASITRSKSIFLFKPTGEEGKYGVCVCVCV